MGVEDNALAKILQEEEDLWAAHELASTDAVFAATGVTTGSMLNGVKRIDGKIRTHSIVMSSFDGVVRTVTSFRPA